MRLTLFIPCVFPQFPFIDRVTYALPSNNQRLLRTVSRQMRAICSYLFLIGDKWDLSLRRGETYENPVLFLNLPSVELSPAAGPRDLYLQVLGMAQGADFASTVAYEFVESLTLDELSTYCSAVLCGFQYHLRDLHPSENLSKGRVL